MRDTSAGSFPAPLTCKRFVDKASGKDLRLSQRKQLTGYVRERLRDLPFDGVRKEQFLALTPDAKSL